MTPQGDQTEVTALLLKTSQDSTRLLELADQEKKNLAQTNMKLVEHTLLKEGAIPESALSSSVAMPAPVPQVLNPVFNVSILPNYLKTKSGGR